MKSKIKNKKPRRRTSGVCESVLSLAFAELEVLARAGLAGFFALAHAGVARGELHARGREAAVQ